MNDQDEWMIAKAMNDIDSVWGDINGVANHSKDIDGDTYKRLLKANDFLTAAARTLKILLIECGVDVDDPKYQQEKAHG